MQTNPEPDATKKVMAFIVFIVIVLVMIALYPTFTSLVKRYTDSISVEGGYECETGYSLVGSSNCNVTITNKNRFEWTNVNIALNDVYKYAHTRPITIVAGQTHTVNLADFVKSDGYKFDFKAAKILKITVRSDQGSYKGVFGN